MKLIARILSTVLHPLLMPLYGMLLVVYFSYLSFFPWNLKGFLLGIIALFTLLVPMLCIVLLRAMKLIKSVTLHDREDRKVPYLLSITSYILCAILLYRINMPLWVVGFIGGGVISLLITTLITLRWKISAHLTGMGGLLACALILLQSFNMLPLWGFMTLILLAGMLGSSRIILGCHTFAQTLAGTVNGFFWVYLTMLLL